MDCSSLSNDYLLKVEAPEAEVEEEDGPADEDGPCGDEEDEDIHQ